jgi:hypothetical protein
LVSHGPEVSGRGPLEATWQRVIRIWWLILWRGSLIGALFGAVLGGAIGFTAATLGMTFQPAMMLVRIVVIPLAVCWGIVVVRMALRKRYSDFRLALVPIP